MSSSISSSGSVQVSNSSPQPPSAVSQQISVEQQLAEASLAGVYGPPYILDVSLAYAVGNTPLSSSPPVTPYQGDVAAAPVIQTQAPAIQTPVIQTPVIQAASQASTTVNTGLASLPSVNLTA